MKTSLKLNILKALALFTLLLILSACREDHPSKIEFFDSTSLLTMEELDKEEVYQSLDLLELYEGDDSPSLTSYSQIQLIESDDHYYQLMDESKNYPILLMFAQEDCPQCKVFVPKLNQLSKELEITIYYYNTEARIFDEDFTEIIADYQIHKVPHAFVVYQEDPLAKIDHLSSMEEIEAFVHQAK